MSFGLAPSVRRLFRRKQVTIQELEEPALEKPRHLAWKAGGLPHSAVVSAPKVPDLQQAKVRPW